jgi:urease accessory protein
MNLPACDAVEPVSAAGRFGGKPAAMSIEFARAPDGLTHIASQYAAYPFHLCRPFRYEGDPTGMATVYVQSASGGLYEHERLETTLIAGEDAAAHVTSQASTIVHEMQGGKAEQDVTLRVEGGAWLEYLPDPLILFPGARVESRTRLVLAEGAQAILADSFLAHDSKAAGRTFDRLQSEIRIETVAGNLLACDSFSVEGAAFRDALGFDGNAFATHGSMAMLSTAAASDRALVEIRAQLDMQADCYGGVSLLPNDAGVWARLVARDGAALRRVMAAIWVAMRRSMTGTEPALRRK